MSTRAQRKRSGVELTLDPEIRRVLKERAEASGETQSAIADRALAREFAIGGPEGRALAAHLVLLPRDIVATMLGYLDGRDGLDLNWVTLRERLRLSLAAQPAPSRAHLNDPRVHDDALRLAEIIYGDEYRGGEGGAFSARAVWENPGEGHGGGRWRVSIFTGDDRFDGEIVCQLVDASPGIARTGLNLEQVS